MDPAFVRLRRGETFRGCFAFPKASDFSGEGKVTKSSFKEANLLKDSPSRIMEILQNLLGAGITILSSLLSAAAVLCK